MSGVVDLIGRGIRRAPVLHRADWLWNGLRPSYERLIAMTAGSRGLRRTINGTDPIRIAPASRRLVGDRYEPEIWRAAMNLVRTGDTVVDVGAHIGLYAIALARRVGEGGRVIAIEPDPGNAELMEQNVRVNQLCNLEIVRAAAGAHDGETAFIALNSNVSHVAAIVSHNRELGAGAFARGTVRVPMVALDTLLAGLPVNFIKIDVEGYEEPVLAGACELLRDARRRPRAILLEVHPFAWEPLGTTGATLTAFFTQCGYRLATPAGGVCDVIDRHGHLIALAA